MAKPRSVDTRSSAGSTMAGLDRSLDSTSAFRLHVRNISVQLTSEETDQLGYILLLPQPHYKDKSALTVLASLEMQGHFSAARPEGLIKVLKLIKRMDLVKITQAYIKESAKTPEKCKDSASTVDESIESAHFEVALAQSVIMMNQIHRLKCVIQDPEVRSRVENAEKMLIKANRMLCNASSHTTYSSLSSDDDSGGRQLAEVKNFYLMFVVLFITDSSTPNGSSEDLYEDLSNVRMGSAVSTKRPSNSSLESYQSSVTTLTIEVGGATPRSNIPSELQGT